jgi:hypothetical protein
MRPSRFQWKLERRRLRALAGIEAGLQERDDDLKEHELTEGAGASRVEHKERTLAGAAGKARPFGPQEVALMTVAISPATGHVRGARRKSARRHERGPPERPAGRGASCQDSARSPLDRREHRKF